MYSDVEIKILGGRYSGLSSFLFGLTSYDLDLLDVKLSIVFHLEMDVLDDESPNLVTEAIDIKMTLW